MNTSGKHLLAEYFGCPGDILDCTETIESLMVRAALAAKTTIVGKSFHRFAPQGVSGVVLIAESHLSVHTWPEANYAAIDFFTCGSCIPDAAHPVLLAGLQATRSETMLLERGLAQSPQSIRVAAHRIDPAVPDDLDQAG